ncbi:hypothetical protein [Streptosporangium canum]|uniref:hypothetical protein n=1 Tax=Streptosporangium canum TaxID=324952 RepID=UPI0037A81499
MADLTFAAAQRLDRLMLHIGANEWTAPLLLVTQPELCLVPGQCRRAEALTADGRTIPVHALASTPIRVLSSAPLMTPVADPEDAMSAHLAQRAGDPEGPVPVRGGPALDPQTEHEYQREQLT